MVGNWEYFGAQDSFFPPKTLQEFPCRLYKTFILLIAGPAYELRESFMVMTDSLAGELSPCIPETFVSLYSALGSSVQKGAW